MTLNRIFPLTISLILLILLGFTACDDNSRFIKPYYFPINELNQGLVYEYGHPKHDSVAPFYNYYRIIKKNDSTGQQKRPITYLVGMRYNHLFQPEQLSVEEQISNGMLLTESILYQTDSTGKQISMPVEIEVGSAYPFDISTKGGVFVYNIKWYEPESKEKFTTLIRNRSFGADTTYTFNGKKYDAIQLNLKEKVESFDEGFIEHDFSGVEIYAKDIGLVYYRKNVAPGFVIEYELKDRYPMQVLEEKFGKEIE